MLGRGSRSWRSAIALSCLIVAAACTKFCFIGQCLTQQLIGQVAGKNII